MRAEGEPALNRAVLADAIRSPSANELDMQEANIGYRQACWIDGRLSQLRA